MTSGGRGTGSRRRPAKGKRSGASGASSSGERPKAFGLGPLNFLLLAAAAASIAGGYVLLDRGSVTAAPFLLVLGYVILIPAGLLVGWRRDRGG